MAQDLWTLQGGKKPKVNTGAWAATAGPCCSCQRGSPCNLCDDPGAHGNEQGAGKCKTERGKNDEGSRYGMAKVGRQTQLADDPAGTGLAAKQPADEVGRPLAMQCRLVEGVRWCWPLRGRARTYLTVSLPTYRLCLSVHTHSLNL